MIINITRHVIEESSLKA